MKCVVISAVPLNSADGDGDGQADGAKARIADAGV